MIFDGKAFAHKIEGDLKRRVDLLPKKPKLVAIVDPGNEAGVRYSRLKAKTAQKLGVEFEIVQINSKIKNQKSKLKLKIQNWNRDEKVDGIMIQLPFPGSRELIPLIDPAKDVDGLREDSPFVPATVRAVRTILNAHYSGSNERICVVGSKGVVGKKLIDQLNNWPIEQLVGMDKEDFDPSTLLGADVIISATGQADLINGSMVKDGFMAIDVGYPKAEFTHSALLKASFYTPVPGGVGPVTVVMLFANLVEAVEERLSTIRPSGGGR